MDIARSCARFVAAVALLLLPPATVGRCDEADDPDPIRSRQPAVEARQKRIAAELAQLDRAKLADDDWAKDFAGAYHTGGTGMSVTISVAPHSGVAYTLYGCLGLYEANHGDIVEATPEGMLVKWAVDPLHDPHTFINSRLYFVRWGQRRYLVPQQRMLDLASDYNRGGYHRESLMLIPKRFDTKLGPLVPPDKQPPGRPHLPPKYARLIIDKPTRLAITSIEMIGKRGIKGTDIRDVECNVELDGGRQRGLFVGTEIECDHGGLSHGSIVLYKVDETKSWGKLTTTLYEKRDRLPPKGFQVVLPGANPDGTQQAKTH